MTPQDAFLDSTTLDAPLLDLLIDEHTRETLPRLNRLWDYYRNDLRDSAGAAGASGRPYALAQEQGLPARLLRRRSDGSIDTTLSREIAIENDIGGACTRSSISCSASP